MKVDKSLCILEFLTISHRIIDESGAKEAKFLTAGDTLKLAANATPPVLCPLGLTLNRGDMVTVFWYAHDPQPRFRINSPLSV